MAKKERGGLETMALKTGASIKKESGQNFNTERKQIDPKQAPGKGYRRLSDAMDQGVQKVREVISSMEGEIGKLQEDVKVMGIDAAVSEWQKAGIELQNKIRSLQDQINNIATYVDSLESWKLILSETSKQVNELDDRVAELKSEVVQPVLDLTGMNENTAAIIKSVQAQIASIGVGKNDIKEIDYEVARSQGRISNIKAKITRY